MKANWNQLYAEAGERSGIVPTLSKVKPLPDRIKTRMVAVLRSRGWLTSVYAADRSLVTYMKDSKGKNRKL